MRWISLAAVVAVLGLSACSQADNLYTQMHWSTSGIGYDVRSTATPAQPSAYESAAAYVPAAKVDEAQITRNVLYRGVSRVKNDGYDYVLVLGPAHGTLKITTTQGGRVVGGREIPAIRFRMVGYKENTPRPPQAVEAAALLTKLKAQVTDL